MVFTSVRSFVSLYLVVVLAIPPQVWAEIQSVPQANATSPAPKESDRDKLRLAAHEAGRNAELAVRKLGDAFASSLKQFKTVEYRMVLEPYALCAVPSSRTAEGSEQALANLDSALAQFQTLLVQFFEKKGPSLVDLSGSEPEEGLEALPVDVLSAKAEPCVPQVPASLSASGPSVGSKSTPENWEAALESRSEAGRIESSGLQFLQPFFVELGRKRSDSLALTDAEARRWIGWLSLLKDFRNSLAKQVGITSALPDLILPPGPSQRVAANDVRVAQNRTQQLLAAGEMLKATQLSEVLPRFVECETMKTSCGADPTGGFPKGSLCFCGGQSRDASVKIRDAIQSGLSSAQRAKEGEAGAHGALLNAERLLAIETLLMETATVAALLPKSARPENLADLLPDACRASPELADHVKIFETYSTVEFREWWLLRLQDASEDFSENIRVGKQTIATPEHPAFFAKADALLKAWAEAVYADAAAPGPKTETLQMIEAFPFKERLLDAGERSSFSGKNFASDLARLISVWGTLIPWEFEKLTPALFEKRDALIGQMFREAYASALTTALQGFGSALFSVDPTTHTKAMQLWESRFRSEWDKLLHSRSADAPVAFELDKLASTLSKDFLSSAAFQAKYSPEDASDQALSSYVREAGPRSRDAFISNQVEQFMGAHAYQGPANFFPGMPLINPGNYDYQSSKIKNSTEAPAAFQVQDNTGRGKEWYEIFISTIHPGEPGDYLALKRALKALGAQHVDRLTNRIAKALSKAELKLNEKEAAWILKEYSERARRIKKESSAVARAESLLSLLPDEEVTESHRIHCDAIAGRFFGAGAGVQSIAASVIEQWNTVLEANESWDTSRAREARRSGFAEVSKWLASEMGRKEFYDNRQAQSAKIYNYHLRSLLELRTPENAASVDGQIAERIKRAAQQEAWPSGSSPETATALVVSAYDRYLKMIEAGKFQNEARLKHEKNLAKNGPFDAWAAFCQNDPDTCLAWFKESTLLYSSDALASYFENRVRRSTTDLMKQFLESYGDGKPVLDLSDPLKLPPNVKTTRNKLLALWVGELQTADKEGKPIEQPRYDEVRPRVDSLLLSLSKLAHEQKSNALALESLPATLTALLQELDLVNKWQARIKNDLSEIEAAIVSKDPARMASAQGLVLRVLYLETMYLLDGSRDMSPQNLREDLYKEVAHAVLPSFSSVRDQMNAGFTELLAGDANQTELLAQAEERRVELRDLLWDQKEQKKTGKDPHRSIEAELANLEEKVIPKLKKQIHRGVVLGNLLQQYVPEAVRKNALQGTTTNLWLSFLNRQFLHTLKDARGEAMALSMAQTIKDLNAIAKKLEAPLPIQKSVAKRFVEESVAYFSAMNSTPAAQESFDKFFAQTLSFDRNTLGLDKKVSPEMFAELVKRLERVWVGSNGKSDGFAEWLGTNKSQSSENFRGPLFVNGLARLSMVDAEQWRVIEHAIESGDPKFEALLQFSNGKDVVVALTELKALWSRIKGSEDGWKDWIVGIARDPELMKQELIDKKPMGDGFPKGTLYLESVLAKAKALLPQLESSAAKKETDPPPVLEGQLRADYEGLVRLISDVLYHPGSQLGPWANSPTEVVWPNFPPTTSLTVEVAQSADGIFGFVGGGRDSRYAMESLLSVFSLPGVNAPTLKKLISPFVLNANELTLPEFGNVGEKVAWLNNLSSQARIGVFTNIQESLNAMVLFSTAVDPELVTALNSPVKAPVSRAEWLIKQSVLLGALQEVKANFTAAPKDVNASGPDALAVGIVRSFLDYTSFRIKDGRWVVAGKETAPSREESLEAFRSMLGADRRRALETLLDLERKLFNEVNERGELAFEGLFQLPETPSQPGPLESAVELVAQRFHPAALAQKTLEAAAVDSWKRAYLSSSLTGKSPFEAKFVEYEPSWIAGIPSDETAAFSEWANRLLNNPSAEKVFQELKAQKPGLETHLWEQHASLKAAIESKTLAQIKGLMKVADANSRYSPLEKSYPFFLVLLDEKLSKGGTKLENGAGIHTFTEPMRAHFLGELVDVLDLDRKAFSGWETLLKRRGQPEHFAMMAESKRNLLVGVADNRFLSTGITADWVGRDLFGRRQANYSPIPVVSSSERALLALDAGEKGEARDFASYVTKLKSPEIDAVTRMHSDGAFSRPLYQNLLSIQMQMHGERDVKEGEARLAHLTDSEQIKVLKYRGRRHESNPTFGSGLSMDEKKVRQVAQALKVAGVFPVPSDAEIRNFAAIREKYVDFKHSLGEMGTFSSSSIAAKLKLFLTQVDPALTPTELTSLTNAALNTQIGTVREAALEVALESVRAKIYGSQSEDQKKRTGAVLVAIDQAYTEAVQKQEVQEALGVVLKNNRDYLTKLCDPSTATRLLNVKSKEDFSDVESLLKETGLAFSTGLHKYLYFDSGLVKNGEGNETRRRVDAIVRKASAYRKTLDTVGQGVNWTVGIGLFAFLFSKPLPGVGALGKVVMRGSAARVGTLGVSAFIAGYFGWEILDDAFGLENLFGETNLGMIRKISETQFKGYSPLRRDKDVGELEKKAIADSVESRTSTPYLHGLWTAWMTGVTYSMLSPLLRAASGGVRYAWQTRFRFGRGLTEGYVNRELAKQASDLGLPVKSILSMPESEAALRIEEAQAKRMLSKTGGQQGKGTAEFPEMAQAIFPSEKAAKTLQKGLDAELKSLAAQNYLNPITGARLRIPLPGGERQSVQVLSEEALRKRALELKIPQAEMDLAKSAGELRGLVAEKEAQRQIRGGLNPKVGLEKGFAEMRKSQDAAFARFQEIKAMRSKLSGPGGYFKPADLEKWLGTGSDAVFLNTPMWTYLLGFPFYTSEVTRLLGGLQSSLGHQRAANRLLATKWLLKWRNSGQGFGAFREAADQAGCTTLELFQAAMDPTHKLRSLFSIELDSSLMGKIGTLEGEQGARENLIRAVNELSLIMDLGGWRGDEALLKLLADRSNVASDRALIKHALTDAYREPLAAAKSEENQLEGESLLESALDESSALVSGEVEKSARVSVRGIILPEDIRTEAAVLDYLEIRLLERRLDAPDFKPLLESDFAFIKAAIERREPKIAAVLAENGTGSAGKIFGRRFRAIDVEEAILRLKEKRLGDGNLMPAAREEAYRALVAYLAAYESHGQGVEFERAVAFFREVLDFSGPETGIKSARLAYEALFGKSPLGANGLAGLLRKTNAITGTLGGRPLSRKIGTDRLNRIEKFLKAGTENESKARSLARLSQIRRVFDRIAKEDGLEAVLLSIRSLSPKEGASKNWLTILQLHLANKQTGAPARTPEALTKLVGSLLEREFSASELEAALLLASKQEALTAELGEAFRYALSYTRAVERVAAESSVFQPDLARWYSEVYLRTLELTKNDLPVADAMFSSIVGKSRLREFEQFERALGFMNRPTLGEVQERVSLLKTQFEELGTSVPAGLEARSKAALERLDSIQSAFDFRGGADFGFESAWAEFLAKSGNEAGGVPQLLSEFINGTKTNRQIAESLVEFRLQVIREAAQGVRPATSIDALNRGTLLIRSRILSKLAASEEVVPASELEKAVRSLYAYQGEPYSGFSLAEAESFLVEAFKHNRDWKLELASLRKYENLVQLQSAISKGEWPTGVSEKLHKATNTLFKTTERANDFEKSLLAVDNPLALGWEQVTQSEFLENPALFHFVMGGSETEAKGVSILRALLVERPERVLEEAVSRELNQMHRTSINNQVRENEQRAKNGKPTLPMYPTGPQDILAGLEERRSWALMMDRGAELIQLERAIERLNSALRGTEWKAPSSAAVEPVISPVPKTE